MMTTSNTIRVEVPKLHRKQRDIYRAVSGGDVRFGVLACGRRFGKTTLATYTVTKQALKTGQPYAYFAPTYKMLVDVWRDLRRTLAPVTLRVSEQEKRLDLINGAVIECWSLDSPDTARGRKYAGVVVDEAAMIRALQDTWNATLRPLLTDLRGWALFLSTPRGRNGFFELYVLGNDPLTLEWQSWQYPTISNPHIDSAEVAAARETTPLRTFNQEYLAEFLDNENTVFRKVRDAAIITTPPTPPRDGIVIGVDWAMQSDFTVLVAIDRNTGEMVDLDRFNQIDWALQRGRLKAMADRWNAQSILAEENSIGSPNIEALRREGMPVVGFTTTASSKPPLIESLVLAFERGEIAIFDNDTLINELEAYERTVNAHTGRPRYNAPPGMHDDTVIALALAWHATTSRRGIGVG